MRKRLLIVFLPLTLLLLLAAGVLSYSLTKRSLTQKVYYLLESIASLQKNRIDAFFHDSEERFDLIVDRILVRILVDGYLPFPGEKDRDKLNRILRGVISSAPDLKSLSLLSPKGIIIASTDPSLIHKNYSTAPIFIDGKTKNIFDVVELRGEQQFGAYFSGPLKRGANDLGVILAEENLDRLFPWIHDYSGLGDTGEAFLAEKLINNDVLYITSLRFDSTASFKRKATRKESALLRQIWTKKQSTLIEDLDYRGKPVIAATRFIENLNWCLVVKMDKEEAFTSVSQLRNWFLVLFIVSVLGMGFLAHVVAKSFVKPIEHLTWMAQEIQAGSLRSMNTSISYKDEVGILANAFVAMTGNLILVKENLEQIVKRRTEELGKSEERARSIVETANDAFIEIDADGLILDWNRQADVTFGWARSEAIGQPIQDLILPINIRRRYQRGLRRLLSFRRSPILNRRIEMTALHKNGQEFPVELTVWRGRGNGDAKFNAFIHDITDRKMAEQTLQRKQKELARANAEREQLDLFASVAAHDLQEPLKKIVAFGDLLREEFTPLMSQDGIDYLNRMRNGAKRMSELISDLLKFSRVTVQSVTSEAVNVRSIIEEVLSDLEFRIRESGAHITMGELPDLTINRVQLQEVFRNLIGNAIKFRKMNDRLEVVIQARSLPGGEVEFSVQDNGIGFDPKYSERIFRPFERLHPRNKYEGSGVGLAICQKIVSNHGGKIFAKSTPGIGTTFIFTLPQALVVRGEARHLAEQLNI